MSIKIHGIKNDLFRKGSTQLCGKAFLLLKRSSIDRLQDATNIALEKKLSLNWKCFSALADQTRMNEASGRIA